eukprot:1288782-Lingulodinium_polyedra.AAC.1
MHHDTCANDMGSLRSLATSLPEPSSSASGVTPSGHGLGATVPLSWRMEASCGPVSLGRQCNTNASTSS